MKTKDFMPSAVYVLYAAAKDNPKRMKQLEELRRKILRSK